MDAATCYSPQGVLAKKIKPFWMRTVNQALLTSHCTRRTSILDIKEWGWVGGSVEGFTVVGHNEASTDDVSVPEPWLCTMICWMLCVARRWG